jgi:hypothetical protein
VVVSVTEDHTATAEQAAAAERTQMFAVSEMDDVGDEGASAGVGAGTGATRSLPCSRERRREEAPSGEAS